MCNDIRSKIQDNILEKQLKIYCLSLQSICWWHIGNILEAFSRNLWWSSFFEQPIKQPTVGGSSYKSKNLLCFGLVSTCSWSWGNSGGDQLLLERRYRTRGWTSPSLLGKPSEYFSKYGLNGLLISFNFSHKCRIRASVFQRPLNCLLAESFSQAWNSWAVFVLKDWFQAFDVPL